MATGQPPQYGDESRSAGILPTTFAGNVLVAIVIALRFTTRIWIVRKVGADDYTILCAALGKIIGSGLVVVQIHYGYGRHKYYLTEWQLIQLSKYSYGEWIQTFQTLMFTKLSICFLLLRIPIEKYFIRPIQLAIVFLVISNVVLTLLWIFQCNPIAGAWNKKTPSKCFTDAQLLEIILSQAVISIMSDFALALFPIALLWKVQINLHIKAGLCALMALGLIAWEVTIGIVAASIPPLRPAYIKTTSFFKSYLSRVSTQRSTTFAHISEGKPSKGNYDKEPVAQPQANSAYQITGPFEAASHNASAEIDRTRDFGIGEEGLAMKSLPGDQSTMDSGIKEDHSGRCRD
ncbi:MAG: hypothetical protein Q9228_004349, partial [Teloschistes exilis]